MPKISCFLMFFLIMLSCNSDDDKTEIIECIDSDNCDECTLINNDRYNQVETDNFSILNIEVNADCLEIQFGSSGCNGENWETELISSETILETSIPQRNLRMKLSNPELCEAYITKTISFNLTNLQLENYDEIQLNIAGFDNPVQYNY
ncbi:hypothetical protein [Zunongwangia atlantica]|uniref:Lipoprotein n=1 Tax=Zunongwangia atlantica 22II14-10F7 TaxID=1185767 RepID=A0A1Y1T8U4_9FLAO|nr:hypothetical protein [Zunongwangia atlantica]ORL47488.1 hypothetical protein IIF7_01965 [Zunongwangia atlantica 22II14-10F7]